MRRQLVALVVALSLSFVGRYARSETFTKLDAPFGSNGTYAMGVSDNTIVGYYRDASNTSHGFVYDGSAWITLDHPLGVKGSSASSIDGNNIIGTYRDSSNVTHGFLYDGSTWQTLDNPDAVKGTYLYGISGDNVVGIYRDANYNHVGFLYNGSTYTTLTTPTGYNLWASDISGSTIVGFYVDSIGYRHGVIDDDLTYTVLDYPSSSESGLCVNGISGDLVVGEYYSFADGLYHGCVYDGSEFTTVDCPFGTSTFLSGVSGNMVVGYYCDSVSGPFHSFATTVPEPSTIALLGAGAVLLVTYALRRRRCLAPV